MNIEEHISQSSSRRKPTVAIIDDESMVTQSLGSFLKLETDFEVLTYQSPAEALETFERRSLDLVISDFLMPEMNGLELLSKLKHLHPEVPRILLTGYADKENAIRAINEVGLYQYVEKPWDNEQLLLIIRNAVAHKGLNELLKEKLSELDHVLRHRDELFQRDDQLRRELDLARQVQRSLLPETLPVIEGVDFATAYRPAMEIGGDFYDIVRLADDRWALLLADATGHGIQAALSTALLKFALGSFVGSSRSAAEIIFGINSILRRGLPADVYVAGLLLIIDPAQRKLSVINGGLPHPYLLKRDKKSPQPLACTGLLLGFAGDELYRPGEEVTVDLANGGCLLLYTDGVTETSDEQGVFFEDRGLAGCLQQLHYRGCNDLVTGLVEAVEDFRSENSDRDDLTVLGIEFKL